LPPSSFLSSAQSPSESGQDVHPESRVTCDNPPRKVPYYRLRPIHFGH
jgi:hypothetical protein